MRSWLLTLLSLSMLLAPNGHGMPGQTTAELEKQLKTHPFFPEAHLAFGMQGMHTFKELTQGRILRFLADQEFYIAPKDLSRGPVMTEILLISNQRIDQNKPEGDWGENSCLASNHFPMGLVSGNVFDEVAQKAFQACKPTGTPSFLDTRETRLTELLEQVYGKNSALVADFKQATLVGKGIRYFYLFEETHTQQVSRRQLSIPPVEQQVFRGNRFDFLIMDHTLLVARKNAFAPLRQHWEQDLAQLRKNAQESAKARPFDY